MQGNDTRERFAAEDAATWGSTAGSQESTGSPEVLAQIPKVDAPNCVPEMTSRIDPSHGRIISQGISTKLLVGGGIILVLGAIIPLLLRKGGDSEGGRSPAPNAELAPIFDPQKQPAYTPPQSAQNRGYEPNMSYMSSIPPGPSFANPVGESPAAAGRQDGTSAAGMPVPNIYVPVPNRDYPARQPLTGTPTAVSPSPPDGPTYDGRFEASRPGRGYYQPYDRPRAIPNQPATIQDRSADSASGVRGDSYPAAEANTRADHPAYYQADIRADPAFGYRRPGSMPPLRPAEPGVARFKGTIEQPTLRTTHGRTGSGVY